MPIIVDGYNLKCADGHLDIPDLEGARKRIIQLLARYSASRELEVIVVFDGGVQAAYLPRHSTVHGVAVVYSSADSSADTEIKRMVSTLDNPHNIRVVTSDREIQRFVRRFGAEAVSSQDFLRELRETFRRRDEIPSDEPIEKYGGASDDADYWLDVFGEGDEQESPQGHHD